MQDIEDTGNIMENHFEMTDSQKKQTQLQQKVETPKDVSSPKMKKEKIVIGNEKIFIKTYGCAHNMSDSEFMIGQLSTYGYQIVNTLEECDLLLINSCTVKNPSEEACVTLVRKAKSLNKEIIVAGCIPQADKNIKELEDVSWLGVTQVDRVVEAVNETLKGNIIHLIERKGLPTLLLPKIRKNNLIEIIPLNNGCLGACTYCKTVQAKGKLESYSEKEILARVDQVVNEGVKEIWLSSEDSGAFGRDIGSNIAVIMKKVIERLPSDIMIRLGMTNPPFIMAHMESMAKILNHPRVFSFIHIPVQSGSNIVLDRMNRQYSVEEFEELCDYLVEHVPNITLATDIICGFSGETDEDFDKSIKLVEKYKMPVVNISQMYPRPNTPAFFMPKVRSQDVKQRSRDITHAINQYECHQELVGTKQLIWINQFEESKKFGKQLVGHTKNYTKVPLTFDEKLLGKCVQIKVTKALRWHVEGEIIDYNPKMEEVNNKIYFENYNEKGFTEREKKLFESKEVKNSLIMRNIEEEEKKISEFTKRQCANKNIQNENSEKNSNSDEQNNTSIFSINFANCMIALGVIGLGVGLVLRAFKK